MATFPAFVVIDSSSSLQLWQIGAGGAGITNLGELATNASYTDTNSRRFHAAGDGSINGVWVAWLTTGNELKLYRRSNVTTYTQDDLPTGTTSTTWDQLLLARTAGGAIICLIDTAISGGRPNIQACYWNESDGTFGAWTRIATETDWSSDTMRQQVCWQENPTDGTMRLGVNRSNGALYLYEEALGNQAPTTPTVLSPQSGTVADVDEAAHRVLGIQRPRLR